MSDDGLVVRSYRRVFRLDRRIYRVDRFVLPLPGGLSLAALLWFVGALLGTLALSTLPVLGTPLDLLSPPLRYALVPAGLAALATQLAPDGRSAPRFALGWLAWRLRPSRRAGTRAVPRESEALSLHATIPTRPRERAGRPRPVLAGRSRPSLRFARRRRGRLEARLGTRLSTSASAGTRRVEGRP